MHRKVTLDQVKRELRSRVCQHCPMRTPGKPGEHLDSTRPLDCEPACELFEHLPRLAELAVRLDPMLQSVEEVLQRRISRTIDSIHRSRSDYDGRSSPLNRHRRCVVQTLTELVGQ